MISQSVGLDNLNKIYLSWFLIILLWIFALSCSFTQTRYHMFNIFAAISDKTKARLRIKDQRTPLLRRFLDEYLRAHRFLVRLWTRHFWNFKNILIFTWFQRFTVYFNQFRWNSENSAWLDGWNVCKIKVNAYHEFELISGSPKDFTSKMRLLVKVSFSIFCIFGEGLISGLWERDVPACKKAGLGGQSQIIWRLKRFIILSAHFGLGSLGGRHSRSNPSKRLSCRWGMERMWK